MNEQKKGCTEAHHELELLGKAMGSYWGSIAGGIANIFTFIWAAANLTSAQAEVELMFEFLQRYMDHIPKCDGMIIATGDEEDEDNE